MASQMMIPIALLLSLLPFSFAAVICEELPRNLCAFSISSEGKRCLLEGYRSNGGDTTGRYHCKTSEVVVERLSDWIETDQCVKACGVDRTSKGISSDALLDQHFTSRLCSPTCFHNCPNIIDLYFNLAAAEGVFLPELCEARRPNPHRSMVEFLSSGAASGPTAANLEQVAEDFALPPSTA